MTDPTPAEALKAEEVVDALFADLRDRKFLKYLFAEDPENHGAYGYIERPFDLDVQQEIADTWRAIVTAGLAPPPPDAGEVRTYREGVESEWQEIETAPKDGTEIDLFGGVSWKGGTPNRVPNCAWKHLENGPDWHTRGDKGWEPLGAIGWEPTHWRALPAPPAFERTLNRSARGGGSEARHLDANIEKWPWLEHDDD